MRSIAQAIRILLRLPSLVSRVPHRPKVDLVPYQPVVNLNLITTSVSARSALARRGSLVNNIDRTGQLSRPSGARKDGYSTSWIFKLLKVWSLENVDHLLLGFKKYFCLKSFFNKILTLSPLKWPHPVEGGGGKGCHKKWFLYLADDP